MTNADLVNFVRRRVPYDLDTEGRSAQVINAMLNVDLAVFYYDEPLPIGYGQTCSEPRMAACL
ncbi:hypothetical protein [Gracilinema caldarium]|uniref:hypothetical protein n=1 Tax=Gracilinema caldarium TaxID=215591 RepID=UPI0026F19A16|nr:hypothetical protein [Gracilinema caldarium]